RSISKTEARLTGSGSREIPLGCLNDDGFLTVQSLLHVKLNPYDLVIIDIAPPLPLNQKSRVARHPIDEFAVARIHPRHDVALVATEPSHDQGRVNVENHLKRKVIE